MLLPHIKTETGLLQENPKKIIFGVDEAGRGPLAGPVVAGAGWINPQIIEKEFEGRGLIRDSKKLSALQRKKIFKLVSQNENFQFGIGVVENDLIDRVNILGATFLAMRFAVDELKKKIKGNFPNDFLLEENLILLVDGNRKIPKIKTAQEVFKKGDQNIFSIALASICAKVWRDDLMEKHHQEYPVYGFDRHKGYGTKFHYEMIKKNGTCPIHRKSFRLG